MKKVINSCIIAFSMFSKIPMPRCDWDSDNMKYMMCFFPWVGAVIGGISWAWIYFAAGKFSGSLFTIVLMLIPFFVTGGIHLDGFLDTKDALSSWMPREKRLEILKDVHVGAFAVINGIVYFFLLYAGYSALNLKYMGLLCLVFPYGRVLSAKSILSYPKAKKDGTVATFSKDAATIKVQYVLNFYLVILAGLMFSMNHILGTLEYATGILVIFWYYKKAMKYFGGVTGDTAGYFLCIAELMMILVLAVAGTFI